MSSALFGTINGCFLIALIALPSLLTTVSAQPWFNTIHTLSRRRNTNAAGCPLKQDESAHTTFDRVCEVCHEMFRHQDPNFHSKCRSNCYENETFVLCLNLFSRNVEVGLASPAKRTGPARRAAW